MNKIELRIIGLSYGQAGAGTYIAVLEEVEGGGRKLPIIIKHNEAQYIALKIESMESKSPLIYDLFRTMTESLNADIQEIYIYSVIEGVFYCKIILSDMVDEWEISASIGDALALAISYKCPIFASEEVMDGYGILMDENGGVSEEQNQYNKRKREPKVSLENLEQMLQRAIENEEYEIASQIRDRIETIKLDKDL
jgi:bifunctional DNase/RNase